MEEIEESNNFKRDFVGLSVAIQFVILFISYAATPGYIIPFLNNPLARTVAFLLLLWQAFGIALYAYSPVEPQRKILFGLQTTALLIIFLAPVSLAYLLGPVVSTPRTMAM